MTALKQATVTYFEADVATFRTSHRHVVTFRNFGTAPTNDTPGRWTSFARQELHAYELWRESDRFVW